MTDDWDDVAETFRIAQTGLRPNLNDVLLASLTKHDHLYAGDRLRVGADLKPEGEGCDRATFYRLKGAAADPPKIARRLRYERGRTAQRIFADALRESGATVEDEVACRPLRPTTWAWDSGHGDVLDVGARHLYEIKAPGLDAWRRSRGMPQKLIREAYRYQLSFYFHELKRSGRIDTASWIFLDFEGEFDPVEIQLIGDLLVPLSEIVAIEEGKNRLMWATEPPPRPANTVSVVKVLKGGRKTKKNPTPDRVVEAVERRFWSCLFCDFAGTCQPGPEETPITLALDDPRRVAAVAAAEAEWSAEDAEKKASKQMVVLSETLGPDHVESFLKQEAPPSNPVPPNPPKAAEPPPQPVAILYTNTTDEPPAAPPRTDEKKPWTDDRSKAEKREAAAGLAASMKEIDDRAARGEKTFPVGAGDELWNEDATSTGW